MKKIFVFAALAGSALLAGCASPQHGAIPVVDSGTPVSNQESGGFRITRTQVPRTQQGAATQGIPQGGDSGVVVMVPQGANSAPIQTFPAQSGAAPISSAPLGTGTQYQAPPSSASTPPLGGSYNMPPSGASRSAPTGIPASGSAGSLAADEQLDGPVLAMLTTAQQQQGSGDPNSAAASLERAQRIAPREPQVLYRLAQVRLAQGDAAQAEQVARRGLSYANGRPTLQAGLWELIAQAREKQETPPALRWPGRRQGQLLMDRRVYALADQLLLIERELRALGWWSESRPAPEALASPEPFCVDTLALEQWLQWIFLPRMKLILESDSALPQASGILAMAEVAYAQRGEEVAGLLAALGEFDRLIGGPS